MIRPILGALLAAGLSVPALASPPVWTAHGKACTATLFGSVHILPKDLDWEPEALKAALADADELWFEVPMDDASKAAATAEAEARSSLPAGDSLSAHLSKADQARLKTAAATLGLPQPALERMRPWFAELILAAKAYMRDGGYAGQGVEQSLTEAAPQAARKAFETPAEQIAMFAGAPMADQIASLSDTMDEIVKDPGAYRRLLQAWVKGDDRAIYRHEIAPMKLKAKSIFETMISRRNTAFARALAERLKAPCRAAVAVVGIGHLIGPDGVPAQLRRAGFKVDGPAF
jgi:uncharacterized protein YbaP (TraB family)